MAPWPVLRCVDFTAFIGSYLMQASPQPLSIISIIFFGGTLYICLDIALGITETLGGLSSPPERIRSIPLFVLMNIWPPA